MKTCSEITQTEAKLLEKQGALINIKEIDSQYTFEAEIIDYCTEDDFGIIVQVSNQHKDKIKCINKLPSDKNNHFELDLRASHNGDKFILIRNLLH